LKASLFTMILRPPPLLVLHAELSTCNPLILLVMLLFYTVDWSSFHMLLREISVSRKAVHGSFGVHLTVPWIEYVYSTLISISLYTFTYIYMRSPLWKSFATF
jgi:hypothetical protein